MTVEIIGRAPVGSAKHGLLIHKNELEAKLFALLGSAMFVDI